MHHFTYKTTHVPTGRIYYGVHSTDDPDDGYLGSGYQLLLAIKKYGRQEFVREIIAFHPDAASAFAHEAELITYDLLESDQCFNIAPGGDGGLIRWDKTVYHFVHENGSEFHGTRKDFRVISGMDAGNITRLVQGKITINKGWMLHGAQKAKRGPVPSDTLHVITNIETGETFSGTKGEIATFLSIDAGGVTRLLNGRSRKGWIAAGHSKPKKGPRPSDKQYQFQHQGGEIFIGTRAEMMSRYSLTREQISRIINGREGRNSRKGWTVVE